ncbi:hypothetical protein CYLTODRAFT_490004 [Cylindrobasidium torrendii FP15055 ss-10]|uniref:Uncharacterized protein n=1 Tax=Cylindrobasidium torrendii FP15055 ss-10 TaxID=1314674 RepID=A0A0D7BCH5_9AGAR|nr:hypothetical protein CYLTODRAFT_490004 [Cylindrobasidium torrendii FP15055 ss-10]
MHREQDPQRDTLRASVADAYAQLGFFHEGSGISDLVFNGGDGLLAPSFELSQDQDKSSTEDDADVRTILGGADTPDLSPSTSMESSPRKPSTFSKLKAHLTPRKTSRKVSASEETDEGYNSSNSVKKTPPRRPARLRKQSTRTVRSVKSSTTIASSQPPSTPTSKSGSIFHRMRSKDKQPDPADIALSDSDSDWEELARPSVDAVPDPFLTPQPPPRAFSTAKSSRSVSFSTTTSTRRPKESLKLKISPSSFKPEKSISVPTSPYVLVCPRYCRGSESTPYGRQSVFEDPPTPDALMRQYAAGRKFYPMATDAPAAEPEDYFQAHTRSASDSVRSTAPSVAPTAAESESYPTMATFTPLERAQTADAAPVALVPFPAKGTRGRGAYKGPRVSQS